MIIIKLKIWKTEKNERNVRDARAAREKKLREIVQQEKFRREIDKSVRAKVRLARENVTEKNAPK